MKRLKNIIGTITVITIFAGCTEYLDPNPFDGTYDEAYVWNTPSFAEGVLMQAFQDLHPSSWRVQNNELMAVLTDDAVSSNLSSTAGNFAQGLQSPYFNLNHINTWAVDYSNIFNINKFLENIGSTKYDPDSVTNQIFIRKYKGDAYFLRAYYHWKLLKRFGGLSGSEVMGIPVIKKSLNIEDSYDIPRRTYMETVEAIMEDCDSSLQFVPEQYTGDDLVTGVQYYGSPTKAIVLSLKGIIAAYAASPGYNIDNDPELWDSAASKLSQALLHIDGEFNTDALPPRNFHEPENPDVIWRAPYDASNYSNEINNYPPSLRGSGRTNPSQNLVDAFPDAEGYPISESSIYDPDKPYENRDQRFYKTIVYNNSVIGGDSSVIETFSGGADSRQVNKESGTRTGYYLKKLLSENVTLFPERRGIEPTFYIAISKTDLYLLFAEALNELGGPYDSRYGISSRNLMVKIRRRAGHSTDLYLFTLATQGKEAFREFIRNERRIELCFQDHRYWDLRRWGELKKINADVYGMEITKVIDSTFTYTKKVVEPREYQSFYNPLPFEEVLKMNHVAQNEGW
ncbi:RagB/SusD family nutrient uptake outer membrane protein [Bacteroidota bacterium]